MAVVRALAACAAASFLGGCVQLASPQHRTELARLDPKMELLRGGDLTETERRQLAREVMGTRIPYRRRESLAFCIAPMADNATPEQRARYEGTGAECFEFYEAYRSQFD